MKRFLVRRLGLVVPTFLGITALTFAVARLAPGDPFALDSELAGAGATQVAREAHGLDRPLPLQYALWLSKLVRLDLGRSLSDQRDVTVKLGEALPRTLLLSGLALALAWAVAVPLGVWLSTTARRRLAGVVSALLSVAASVPAFWVAVLLLFTLSSPERLDWFPFQGLHADDTEGLVDLAWHLVLPVFCLAWPTVALVARQVRGAMARSLGEDFVLAARARGVPERQVVWRHALRASLVPLVTVLGLQLPHLVSGSVIVERVFGIPGMGLLAFDAVGLRDYPVVMGAATVMAVVTLLAMLLADLLLVLVDPRIRLEGRG